MRLLITGANGFVGSALYSAAAREGHEPWGIVRAGADRSLLPGDARLMEGEFFRPEDANRAIEAALPDAIVHAAAVVSTDRPNLELSRRVNLEGTRSLLEVACHAGVERWIQISSMSAHPANKSVYGATKYEADRAVRGTGIDWTIVRPSLIYGPVRRGIFWKMTRLVQKLPVIPLVGGGREPMRPVHVDDLAEAILSALETPRSVRQTYCIGGPENWRFRNVVEVMARKLGRKNVLLVSLPLPVCRLAAAGGELVLPSPPLTTDNLEGIAKAEPIDIEPAVRDLMFAPRTFDEGFAACLEQGLIDETPSHPTEEAEE